MTTTADPAKLLEQAQTYAAKAAEAQAELQAIAMREAAEAAEAQAERDRATVEAYSVPDLDATVAETRAAVVEAVQDWSVTQALAAHLAAIQARTYAHLDVTQARGRLGLSLDNIRYPETAEPVLADLIAAAVTQMAADITAAARADKDL